MRINVSPRFPQVRWGLFYGAVIAYVAIFLLLCPVIGGTIAALSVVPVMVAGWFFGSRAALVSGVLTFPINTLLFSLVGSGDWQYIIDHGGPGTVVVILVGLVTGRLHDLDTKLRHELAAHKQTEAALRDRERELRTIIESEPECVKLVSADGVLLEMNPAGLEMIEADYPEQVLKQPVYGLIPPEWHETYRQLNESVFQGERAVAEFEIVGLKGTRRWMETHAVPLRDNDGKIRAQLSVARDITGRKQAEEALRLSEERHRIISELVSDYAYSIRIEADGVMECEWATDSFTRVTGCTAEDIGTRGTFTLVHPQDEPAVRQQIAKVLQGHPTSGEYRIITWAGEVRWVCIHRRPIQDQEGRVIRFYGVAQDITERRLAQDELKALYNATSYLFKADSLLNLGHQIVQAVVEEFTLVDCGLMLFDKTQQKILRLARAGSYGVDPDIPLLLNGPGLVSKAIRTGKVIYAPDVAADSDYMPTDPRTRSELVIPLRTIKGVLGVLDLQSAEVDAFSSRHQRILTVFAERAAAALEVRQLYEELNQRAGELEWRVAQRTVELRQSKERAEAILNNSSDAIILAGADGDMLQVNSAFTTLFGYESDEVLQQLLTTLVQAADAETVTDAFRKVLEDEQPARLEVVVCRKDGSTFAADVMLAPVREGDAPIEEVIGSLRDISERKQVEQELRYALEREKELSELKSSFTSMVSHEFRTPLSIVLSSSELLRQYGHRMEAENRLHHFDRIRQYIRRLADMLDDVLFLNKTETVGVELDPTQLDLPTFCHALVEETLLTTDTHRIELSLAATGPPVYLDEKLLRQMLSNLLSNAIKYSPQGSSVYLDVSGDAQQFIFSVRDEGMGIPEEDQKHLFTDFHRGEHVGTIPGTGLGLAIVKRAVEALNGTIVVESEVGKGTTFTVRFPVVPEMIWREQEAAQQMLQ